MHASDWPEAVTASVAIISGIALVGLVIWQVGRIVETAMLLGGKPESRRTVE